MTLLLLHDAGVEPLAEDRPDPATTALLADDALVAFRIPLAAGNERDRMGEARMRATDLAAQPIDGLHLALGPTLADGTAWLALIDREQLAERLRLLKDQGLEPARLLPAALLLPEPTGSTPTLAMLGPRAVLRGADHAAVLEPELAALAAGSSIAPGSVPPLAQALDPELGAEAPNLLTGAFAPKLRWWRQRRFQLAAGALLLLALLLGAAPTLLARQQAAAVIAEHDAATLALAEKALGSPFADARAAADALARARMAREAGMISARLTAVAAAMADVPGARVASIASGADGHVRLALAGSADAINRLRAQLEAGAFATSGGGTELLLGARRGTRAAAEDPAALALARRLDATADAAILSSLPAPAAGRVALADALAAAGLEPAADSNGGGGAVRIPAARATLLLPLIARLEQQGVRFRSVRIDANPDQTVNALLVPAP